MKIGLDILDVNDEKVLIQKQMGLTHVVSSFRINDLSGDINAIVAAKAKSFNDIGLQFSVYESMGGIEDLKIGKAGADRQMDFAKRMVEACGRNGIRVICYNWMPVVGWVRTNFALPSRGGSTVTGFDIADMDPDERTAFGEISESDLWKSLEAFLREIIPVCEKWNVKMSLHPDDPPIPTPLKGIARIITSLKNYQRVFDLYDSAYNTMTFCQANISAMGEDIPAAIKLFGNKGKISFVHFRDIIGDMNRFVETWHEEGQTDMFRAMKAYCDIGFDGVARPDHVPTMVGEPNDRPMYAVRANLFAVGYMKGLLEALNN